MREDGKDSGGAFDKEKGCLTEVWVRGTGRRKRRRGCLKQEKEGKSPREKGAAVPQGGKQRCSSMEQPGGSIIVQPKAALQESN